MKRLLPLIRQHQLTLLLVFAPLPSLLLACHYFSGMHGLGAMRDRLNILQEKTAELAKQKEKNAFYTAKMSRSEPHYLEKSLESLTPSAITSHENRLLFQEENPIRSELFEETQVKTKQPVLLNDEELKMVLKRVEFADEQAPQLLFKQFKLSKKMTESDEELFELSFELLKRELLKK